MTKLAWVTFLFGCYLSILVVSRPNNNKNKNNNNSSSNSTLKYGTYNFTMIDKFQGTNFFSYFDFFTDSDPTHGFVDYVDESTAESMGLIKTTDSNAYMYADYSNNAPDGRKSIRISSKSSFQNGLFILSLNHMPQGCGTWPAYWLCGPNWPNDGEIDIIEGVNLQTVDQSTLHTNEGCDMSSVSNNIKFNGYWADGSDGQAAMDCWVSDSHQYSNQGCSQVSGSSTSYGSTFNDNGGGYYVTLWDNKINNLLNIWYFDNNNVPNDIKNNKPSNDPINQWGEPNAQFLFGSNCPTTHFQSQSIIFDLTFCGDWAGNAWSSDSTCKSYDSSCDNFVAYNPGYFVNAYWDINWLSVYSL